MNTSRFLLLAALLTFLPGLAAAQTAESEPDPNRPGAKRPGFYLAIDVGGISYDLDDVVEERFTAQGINLSSSASGGGLVFGYSWRNEFALELEFYGSGVSTGRTDVEAGFGQMDIGVRVPLLPQNRIAPYLSGHLGGVVLGFSGDFVNDRAVYGGSTGLGAGVEIHLGRRWALDFGYRFSLVDFKGETIEISGSPDQEIDIDGTGRVHRWALRTTFSF
jgi:opacity protein-like surface antigen